MVALCCAALLGGCKSGLSKKLYVRPGLKVSAVAVYPFAFRWEEPAYRSFELSQRLIGAATVKGGEQFQFFGPSEFQVYRPDDDNPWAASNAVSLLSSAGLRPDQAVVLRPIAERRVHSGQKEVLDSRGKPVGAVKVQDVTYVGRVEILHPSTGDLVVEVAGQAEVDPFAEREDDSDPAPELTALMEALTREAIEALAQYAASTGEPPRELSLGLVFNPKLAFGYAEKGRPPLELKLAALDPVEAELVTQGRVKFANPGLAEDEVAKLSRLPGGLWVRAAPEGSKLKEGDLITQVEEGPALPQSMHRLRFASAPARLKVRRAGEVIQVLFP